MNISDSLDMPMSSQSVLTDVVIDPFGKQKQQRYICTIAKLLRGDWTVSGGACVLQHLLDVFTQNNVYISGN